MDRLSERVRDGDKVVIYWERCILRRSLAREQVFKARLLYIVPNNRFQELRDLLDYKITILDCSLIVVFEQCLALGTDVNVIAEVLIKELGAPTFQENFMRASHFPAVFDLRISTLVDSILKVRSPTLEARVFGSELQELHHTDPHRNRIHEADSRPHNTDLHNQGNQPAGTQNLSHIESTYNVDIKSELASPIEAEHGSDQEEEEQEGQGQGQGQGPLFIDWLCPNLIDNSGKTVGVSDREQSPAYSLTYSPGSTPDTHSSRGNSSDRELSPLTLKGKHWKKRIIEASESEDSVLDTEDTRRFLEGYNRAVELDPSLGVN